MQLKEILEFITQNLTSISSWKFLLTGIFISFSFLGLNYINYFHDILSDMFNNIVISCILFCLLTICKIAFQLHELITWKNRIEHERQSEQKQLAELLTLSKQELSILKYIFTRPTQSAWLPVDSSEAALLLHKNYLTVVCHGRKYIDSLDVKSLYMNSKDTLYTITPEILTLMNKYQAEISLKFRHIHVNKHLNNYQP